MPLPTISTPTYELELPSTGETVKYRPFLVREEKLLVLALESEDSKQITTAIKSVITNCIKSESIKVETLPTFDIEYLFLNIRGKSVGEELEVNVLCPDDEETYVPTTINIDDIKVIKQEGHDKNIQIDEKLMMEMKYPSLEQFIQTNFDFNNNVSVEQSFDLIASCISQIFTAEESWTVEDVTKKEVQAFLDQMNSSQFKKIEKFFATMPKLSHEISVKNPKTGVKSTVVLEGLSSFFA
tara:strand:+ start:7867 stop:8586 length:720 start_codon:yes stop_codon:yes gene_type:complete